MIDPDVISALYATTGLIALWLSRSLGRHAAVGIVLLAIPATSTLRWTIMFLDPHWWLRSMQVLTPCLVAALALHILGGIRPWAALAAWLLMSGAAADIERFPNPVGIYCAAHLSVLAAGFAAILARYPIWHRRDERARHDVDVTDVCTIVLVAQWGLGDLVAAYLHDDPWAEHRFVQRLAVAVCAALILLQGGYLWRQRTRSCVVP